MRLSTRRRGWTALLALAIVLGGAAAACGDDSDIEVTTPAPSAPTGGSPTGGGGTPVIGVSTPASGEVLVTTMNGRQILTDAVGFTLYVFSNDPPNEGTSTCNASCAQAWPPFAVMSTPTGPPEATGTFSTITRLDGSTQGAYNGKPLYRFVNDTAPGETNGEGVAPTWSVATP